MKLLFLFCVFMLLALTMKANERQTSKKVITEIHQENLDKDGSHKPRDVIPDSLTLQIKTHISEHQ